MALSHLPAYHRFKTVSEYFLLIYLLFIPLRHGASGPDPVQTAEGRDPPAQSLHVLGLPQALYSLGPGLTLDESGQRCDHVEVMVSPVHGAI